MTRFDVASIPFLIATCCICGLLSEMPTAGQSEGHRSQGHASAEKHAHGGHGERAGHDHGEGHDQGSLNAPGFHHDFSNAEHWAKRFDAPDRPTWQKPRSVIALMGLEVGMTVADLGAGTGFFLGYLSTAVGPDGRVLALDVAESLIIHMNERAGQAGWPNVDARRIPYDSPGLEPASVDRILIVNTWHHIDARSTYSSKLLQALRPGGAVYVVDYTLDSEHGPPKAHRLAAERVVAELQGGGFEASVMDEDLPRQYVVVARAPAP